MSMFSERSQIRQTLLSSAVRLSRTLVPGAVAVVGAIAVLPQSAYGNPLPSGTVPGLVFQTNGPNARNNAQNSLDIGDWYTSSLGASTDRQHRFIINLTPTDLAQAGGSAVVRIRDAESNGRLDQGVRPNGVAVTSAEAVQPGSLDPNALGSSILCDPGNANNCDPVLYTLVNRNTGAIVGAPINVPGGSPDGTTIAFPPITQPGVYEVVVQTGQPGDSAPFNLSNDQQSFEVEVQGASPDLLLGQFQGSLEVFPQGNPSGNFSLYFLNGPGNDGLFLRNFDLDAQEGRSVNYVSPSGGVGTVPGTTSLNARWNANGDTNTGGDTIGGLGGNFNNAGVWELQARIGVGNQTIFEVNTLTGQRVPLFDRPPRRAGNFLLTPDTTRRTQINQSVDHPFTVQNLFFTTDIVNLQTSGTDPNYTIQLLDDQGNPLPDTDADGAPDTGILQPNQTRGYILRVTPRDGAPVQDTTVISGTSFVDRRANPNPTPQRVQKITIIPGTGASIGDKVFFDNNSNGQDDDSRDPVVGATVTLRRPDQPNFVRTTQTNSVGLYKFDGLAPGNYIVTLTVPNGTEATTTTEYRVTLRENQDDDTRDFGIRQVGRIGDFVFNDLNSNGQPDPGEPPVGGATVTLQLPNGSTRTTTTAPDGTYSFPGLSPGDYEVTITPLPTFTTTTPIRRTLTLRPGETNLLQDFGIRGEAAIGDQVFLDFNANGQQDPGEPGLPGIPVTLTAPGQPTRTVNTDARGRYLFSNLQPGSYTVGIPNQPGLVATTPITRTPTLARGVVDVTNDFGLRGTGSIGRVVFQDPNGNGVQDPGEPGIPGQVVTLRFPGADGRFGTSDDITLTRTTGQDGSYLFESLPPGPYQVTYTPSRGSRATTPTLFTVNLGIEEAFRNANFGVQLGQPNLKLVKRITSATRRGQLIGGQPFSDFIDDPNSADDNALNAAQFPPNGVIDIGANTPLQSGDEVTYTIYFLSDGSGPAFGAGICDAIPSGTSLIQTTPQIQRVLEAPREGGNYFSPLAPLPTGNPCNTDQQTNRNGTVIFDLGEVSNESGRNFGFVRFRVRVD